MAKTLPPLDFQRFLGGLEIYPLTWLCPSPIIHALLPRFANLFCASVVCSHRRLLNVVDAPMVRFRGAVSTSLVQCVLARVLGGLAHGLLG
jgi:hypothetical protein